MERALAVEETRRALRVAAVSGALLLLAGPVLRAYAGRKQSGGLLDYEDLIGRTRRLLVDPGAAWVLYKLDGGIDHLLLDEVQDTAPGQWQIAHTLTEEFFAGLGAGDAHRTFFAVGDPKQSIYSFQGADPEEWRTMIGVNCLGLLYCTHYALPLLRDGGGGDVVNVSSVAGRMAALGSSVYNMTKWGVVGLSSIAHLDDVDVLVTDTGLPDDARAVVTERVGRLLLADTTEENTL